MRFQREEIEKERFEGEQIRREQYWSDMSSRYDAIIIGGGTNGMAAAGLLARQGRRVLLLERRSLLGGMAAGEEFHPGFRTTGLLHDTSGLSREVVEDLQLERHGLAFHEQEPPVFLPERDGPGLRLYRAADKGTSELRDHSLTDADRYGAFRERVEKLRSLVQRFQEHPLPDPAVLRDGEGLLEVLPLALGLRRMGGQEMLEILRLPPLSVSDWLGEWFESELLKAGLAGAAIHGGWAGPRSPGTTTNLLLSECSAGPLVRGGPAAVARALESAVRDEGVEVRVETEVVAIRLVKGALTGVEAENGDFFQAPVVAASCDPKRTFLRLLPPGGVPFETEREMEIFRARGTTAKVNLALDGRLEFEGRPGELFEFARTGESLLELERSFDPVKYGEIPGRPTLDIHVPSVSDPGAAPEGNSVVSILAHFVPYHRKNGWDEEGRKELADAVLETLESVAAGTSERILAAEVMTPVDLERRYALTGGHIHHGEHALDQRLLRPAPGCLRYRTPLAGLYLCGSGTHPGGGVTCRPGSLAAQAILSDGM